MIAIKNTDDTFTLEGIDTKTMQLLTHFIGVLQGAPDSHDELYASMTAALGKYWDPHVDYFEIALDEPYDGNINIENAT